MFNLKSFKMKKISFFILMLIPNLVCLSQSNASWDFPVKPGTVEWSNLKTYQDRLDAYNIPESILRNMSTAELVKTCLAYPEFRLILTRNNLQEGFAYLSTIFNGFNELGKRKDAGIQLINEYKSLNPINVQNYTDKIDQGRFTFKFTYVELILAQKPILNNMESTEKKKLLELGISIFEGKRNLPEYYSNFGLETSSLVMGRLLDVDSYYEYTSLEDSALKRFVASSILVDYSSISKIMNLARSYKDQLTNE
jgi:hypothetical protein